MNVEARDRLSELVKKTRGQMSQRAFSRLLGVSLTAVQGWEEGRSVPGIDNLERIASAAGLKTEDLVAYLDGKPLPESLQADQIVKQIKYMPKSQFAEVVRAVGNRLLVEE